MLGQRKVFTRTQVAYAAFGMEAMALVIVLLHGQHAQLTQGIMIHARARRQHAIIIKGGGNGIAMHAL